MSTATVTSKGQITIPVDIRERYGIEQGTQCLFVALDDGRFQVIPKRKGAFLEAVARFRATATEPPGPPMTNAELHDAIGEWLVEDDQRIMRERREQRGDKA